MPYLHTKPQVKIKIDIQNKLHKHSLSLYEVLKYGIKEISYIELRKLFRDTFNYSTRNFMVILNKSIEEINEFSDINVKYEIVRGVKNTVKNIKFSINY